MAIITPPRRGEFLTANGEPTQRFITWIESLTTITNEVSGEISEASELISGSSEADEVLDGLQTDLAFITPLAEQDAQVITASADYTTTGSQIIICTNTADITITLNLTPDDTEQVHIVRQNTGAVTVSGAINGDTTLQIGQRYSSPHLVFTVAANEWSII
jgi:hypothetical protein